MLLTCSYGTTSNWQKIEADDKSYTCEMPGNPKNQNQSVKVPQGSIEVNIKELNTTQVNYFVGKSTYPKGFLASIGNSTNAIFDKAVSPTVKKYNAEIIESTNRDVNGLPSRTTVLKFYMPEIKSEVIMKQVMILNKNSMYITQTLNLNEKSTANKKRIKRFHTSFQLTK